MKNISFFVISILLITVNSLIAQDYEIDLAEDGSELTVNVESNKTLNIHIINKLPGEFYKISVERKVLLLEPLELSELRGKPLSNGCTLKNIYDQINDANSEVKIRSLIQPYQYYLRAGKLDEFIKTLDDIDSCSVDVKNSFIKLANRTQKTLDPITLGSSEILEIEVSRIKKDGEKLTWKRIYKTPPKGKWITSYGFSFIFPCHQSLYHTVETEGIYKIDRIKNRYGLIYSPSIFFSFIPQERISTNWVCSPTAGLGYDFKESFPTVFMGCSFIYNHNLLLNFGLSANKQNTISKDYFAGQELSEPLEFSKLHEQIYKINPFISVSMRFGKNPFTQPIQQE